MRFQGAAYRAHNPRWSWSPLSGEGARLYGGRFNARGTPALYLALDFAGAVIEFNQGFPFRLVPPITVVSYAVDCEDVVDLTLARERKHHRVEPADMSCAWKLLAESGRPVPSWALADRLRADRVAGIIVPSFSPGAPAGTKNLVLWTWGDQRPHQVVPFDPGGSLPRNDASWRVN